MKKRFWAVILALVSGGLFLRFALRGYAWWGYILLFIAALLVMHRYLPMGLCAWGLLTFVLSNTSSSKTPAPTGMRAGIISLCWALRCIRISPR